MIPRVFFPALRMTSVSRRTAALLLCTSFVSGALAGLGASTAAAALLGSSTFSDVESGSFYDNAVGALSADGIIKGYDGGRFGPNDPVTRAQVAVMLQRFKDAYIDGNPQPSSARSRASSSAGAASSIPAAGAFRFTSSSASVSETYGSLTVTVIRSGGDKGEATVRYATKEGTADAGSDFTETSGTLRFGDGESSKTFKISITDDSRSEGDETFEIVLSEPTGGAVLGSPTTLAYTIVDNEHSSAASASSRSSGSSRSSTSSQSATSNGVSVQFAATAYAVNENQASLTVYVDRVGSTSAAFSVEYYTENGDAKEGKEYTKTTGTLNFSEGASRTSFSVPLIDDSAIDGGKTFYVKLKNATGNVSIGTPSADVFINDNDNTYVSFGSGSFKFSNSEYDADEDNGSIDVVVQRVGGSVGTASVSYSTISSTAVAGLDFTAASGTLSFAPGESAKTIRIAIVEDSDNETGEAFTVQISNPSNGSGILSPSSATVNVYD